MAEAQVFGPIPDDGQARAVDFRELTGRQRPMRPRSARLASDDLLAWGAALSVIALLVFSVLTHL